MKKIAAAILFMVLVSCSNEKEKVINSNGISETSTITDAEQIEEPAEPEIYFVNAKEGLRVRDEPALTGNKVYVLPHKEPVSILKKSEKADIADLKYNHWYFIEHNEIKGWVFGEYLKKTLAEIEEIDLYEAMVKSITGRYEFHSKTVYKEENVDTDEFHNKINEVSFEIEHSGNNKFILTYNGPKNVLFYENETIPFNYPPQKNGKPWYPSPFPAEHEGSPFYGYMGEKGGGGTYKYFYYSDDQITIDYKKEEAALGEEDGELIALWWKRFEFKIIFKKVTPS